MFFRLRVSILLILVVSITLPLAADGAAVYKAKCAVCHAADGSGDTTMGKKLGVRSFSSEEVQKKTDAELLAVTRKGKGKMPAYDGKVPDDDLKAIVALIRSFASK